MRFVIELEDDEFQVLWKLLARKYPTDSKKPWIHTEKIKHVRKNLPILIQMIIAQITKKQTTKDGE